MSILIRTTMSAVRAWARKISCESLSATVKIVRLRNRTNPLGFPLFPTMLLTGNTLPRSCFSAFIRVDKTRLPGENCFYISWYPAAPFQPRIEFCPILIRRFDVHINPSIYVYAYIGYIKWVFCLTVRTNFRDTYADEFLDGYLICERICNYRWIRFRIRSVFLAGNFNFIWWSNIIVVCITKQTMSLNILPWKIYWAYECTVYAK